MSARVRSEVHFTGEFPTRSKTLKAAVAVVLTAACLAGGALAAAFTWNGAEVGGSLFSDSCNWGGDPILCPLEWPDGPNDDATFPWNASGPWPVDLITVEIRDLTIEGNVDFNVQDDPNLPFTLTVTRLKIEPTSAAIEITMGDGGAIEVE